MRNPREKDLCMRPGTRPKIKKWVRPSVTGKSWELAGGDLDVLSAVHDRG